MQKIIFISILLLTLVSCRRIISTGMFRQVKPFSEHHVIHSIPIAGAEDITISYSDDFALIAATERKNLKDGVLPKSDLYLIDLRTNEFEITNLTKGMNRNFTFFGLSLLKISDDEYQIAIINRPVNQDASIEFYRLSNKKLVFEKVLKHPLIHTPNDLVLVTENKFYFTNDHGKKKKMGRLVEEYTGQKKCTIVYYNSETFTEVANKLSFGNGINVDLDRKLLYAASTRAFLIKVYSINTDGSLTFIENIKCKTGVDNIEIDKEGHLWVAGHPKLLVYAAYVKDKKKHSPSEIIKITYRGKKDYSIEKIYIEKGENVSSASVAVPYKDKIIVGSVMDDHFIILEK